VQRAVDPLRALLAQQTNLQAPRASRGEGSTTAASHRSSDAERSKPHPLAALFDRVARGGPKTAEKVAELIEAQGPLEKQMEEERHRDHVWLWAFAGVRDDRGILARMRRHYDALSRLLVKLLGTARSPHRSPEDLLPVFEDVILSTTAREQLSFKKLEELAKKGFHIPKPLVLLEADKPICVYLAVAGAELGRIMATWPKAQEAVEMWWSAFACRLAPPAAAELPELQHWMHGVAFAASFWCNYRPEKAADKTAQLHRTLAQWSALDFGNLLKLIKAVAPVHSSAVAAGQVSAEQRQRLEQSRQAALEKKRQRQAASGETPCDANAQPAGEAPTTKPAADEPAGPRPVTIQEVDEELQLGPMQVPLQGKIVYRSDHKTGKSFHVRLGDATGKVDVKFFEGAFKEHPDLYEGAVVRLSGFKVCELTGKSLDYAPPGRRFYLNCADPDAVNIQILQAPSEAARTQNLPLPLLEAVERPERTYVNVSEAFVADVGEVEFKSTKDGQLALRVICLTPERQGGQQIRWSLWCEAAMNYGHKQLARQRIAIRGAQTKRFGQQRQLVGCFRE
ncbi:unnamed protein product, partial [Symbiodinium microadriaticum]